MSAASIRLIFLSVVTSTRNVATYQLLGVPFERGIKFHKILGRLQLCCIYVHIICMLIGGTTVIGGLQWDDTFSMYRGRNLWPGVVAATFFSMLLVAAMPWFRRVMWDKFYFTHINLQFMGNVFTVFHMRSSVVWIAPAFACWYIDVFLRLFCKMKSAYIKDLKMHGSNLCELTISKEGYPEPGNPHHPGAYIWLALDGKNPGKEDEPLFPSTKVPGGPPDGIPSWLWFHPMTVASFNEETKEIKIFVKSLGTDEDEFSARLCAAGSLVASGELPMEAIECYVGGPNGQLSIDNIETLDRIILLSGGIGVTPMAGVLEGLIGLKAKNEFKGEIIFLWASRSLDEILAFTYLFEQCQDPSIKIQIHYTGNETGISDKQMNEYPPLAAEPEASGADCIGVDCLPNTVASPEGTDSTKEGSGAGSGGTENVPMTDIHKMQPVPPGLLSHPTTTTLPAIANATISPGRFAFDSIPESASAEKVGYF